MTARAGLWIDHRKAVIVTMSGEEETIQSLASHVEKHVRYSEGASPAGSHVSPPGTAEDTRDRRFEGQLDKYYERVVAALHGAGEILIFGPGEAKGELRTRLEDQGLGARVVGVEAADKMTVRQVAARVRKHSSR